MTFDATSTADEVLANIDLTGKHAIVTGGSSGIGEATATALARRGATVTITATTLEEAVEASNRISENAGEHVAKGVLDLSDPHSVRNFGAKWSSRNAKLHMLINNAAVMGVPLTRNGKGWEMQFAANHLGHFVLTNMLAQALCEAGPARVVNTSSALHHIGSVNLDDPNYNDRPYSALGAYAQAATANIWFAAEFDRRFAAKRVRAFAADTGIVSPTDQSIELDPSFNDEVAKAVAGSGIDPENTTTVEQAAATQCWAATAPELARQGGKYLAGCQIAELGDINPTTHAAWAYDEAGASALWDLSNRLLGTKF